MLYRIFGWAGGVVDIYVSRKTKRNSRSSFAFVRFDSRKGAERAVKNLNGTYIGSRRMMVKMAEFRRGQELYWVRNEGRNGYAEVKKGCLGPSAKRVDDKEAEKGGCDEQKTVARRVIKVRTDPIQADLLSRSVVAESLDTIQFEWIKEQIAERWEGPGDVYCRDLGPFKCILTFNSVEARDFALVQEGVDRDRVLVHLWSEETFMSIGKIYGKPVMMDELTDYCLSYTCDSFPSTSGSANEESMCRESASLHADGVVNEEDSRVVVPETAASDEWKDDEELERTGASYRREKLGEIWDPIIDDILLKRDKEMERCNGNNKNGGCATSSRTMWFNEPNHVRDLVVNLPHMPIGYGDKATEIVSGLCRIEAHMACGFEVLEPQLWK
ncbi:hypothetical protein PIB30_018767 [Stylosanthes scabra]|uniref:RRM domain-containing protein n=1 Tax=Stylosanthes scabra TaxID=79078 RepID=A0ABU6Q8J1_9FABA|nr:hypothetical protein [Stylosanthes scabra]